MKLGVVSESLWWCFRRQVRVVGGWHNAVWCLPLIWRSAREVQAEIRAFRGQYADVVPEWASYRKYSK